MIGLLLLLVFPAHADWEAGFVGTSSQPRDQKVSGKFYSKVERFRVDTVSPIEMSFYAKSGATRVNGAVHSFRIRLSSNLEKFSAQVPGCLSLPFAECVKKYSLKLVREEKCAGTEPERTCEVYAGTTGMKGVKRLELWHWKGESEPIFSRFKVAKKDGSEFRVEFKDFGRKVRDDAFFEVPANYQNAGTLEKFIGDFKGDAE